MSAPSAALARQIADLARRVTAVERTSQTLYRSFEAADGSTVDVATALQAALDGEALASQGQNQAIEAQAIGEAAQATGEAAQATGDAAVAAAAAAQTTANGKNTTFVQATAPTATAVGDLWVDTSSNNELKRWNGTTWASVRDANIAAAQAAATAAQTTANGKGKAYYQASAPASGQAEDVWFDTDDGNAAYRWNGSTWVQVAFGSSAIANLDAGKITTGTLDAARIGADSITATQIAANAITSSELAANAVVAGKIAAGTVTANEIAANTITAAKIAAGTITAAEIAANTITAAKIAAGTITGTELNANAINGMTITGAMIQTAASGKRVTLSSTDYDRINLYTGTPAEVTPGNLSAYASNAIYLSSPKMTGQTQPASIGMIGQGTGGAITMLADSVSISDPLSSGVGGNLTIAGNLLVNRVITANAPSASLELGSIAGTANTPYIDFHSYAGNNDYDARIIASGGAGATNGAGTLDVKAASLKLNGVALGSNQVYGPGTPNGASVGSSISTMSSLTIASASYARVAIIMATYYLDKTVPGDGFEVRLYDEGLSTIYSQNRDFDSNVFSGTLTTYFSIPANTTKTFYVRGQRIAGTGTATPSTNTSYQNIRAVVMPDL